MSSWAIWKPRPVFVTSTFTDMQAERDYLRNHVFPELEQRLKERFCHLEPIDLRWGALGESSLDQQTLNIWFGKLRRCQSMSGPTDRGEET